MTLRIYLEEVVGENCASIDDGGKVFQLVRPELVKGFQVEIDFKGINLMLTPFLNACFGKLLEQFGREIVMTNISMRNISNEFPGFSKSIENSPGLRINTNRIQSGIWGRKSSPGFYQQKIT